MIRQSTTPRPRLQTWLGGLLALLMLVGFTANAHGQTEIFSEDGGGAAPTGWTFINNNTSNDIDRSSYWLVDDGDPSDQIITTSYDLSTFASAEFNLDVATFGSGTANPAKIEISFDGGANYTQVELTNTPSSSTYIDGGVIVLNSVSNNVVLRISNNGTSGRGVRLRNLELTGLGSTGEALLTVDKDNLIDFSYTFGNGPSSSQTFTLSGSNLDGSDVSITAPTSFEVSESEASGYGSSVTLSSYDGTNSDLYVRLEDGLPEGSYSGDLTISGGGADDVTVSLEGSVVAPFGLPYSNPFRTQDDYDSAIAAGFTITSTDQRTAAGGYLKIDNGQFVESPSLDLTANSEDALVATYNMQTFGGGSTPEFSFLVSEDGGSTFQTVASDAVPGSYDKFDNSINLSTLGSLDNVVVKLEQTDGTQSTRFRDFELSLEAPPTDPTLSVDVTELTDFSYTQFNGPSDGQAFTLSGSNLDGSDVSVTAPTGFEVSDALVTGYGSSVTLSAFDGSETELFVRLAEGLDAGDYSGDLTLSGGGATDVTISLEGTVDEAPPAISEEGLNYRERFRDFVSYETLPAGWESSDTDYGGDWGTGTGSGLRGNDDVLGYQHTGGTGTHVFTLTLENNTGSTIGALYVEYEGLVERVDAGRSPAFTVEVAGQEVPALSYSTEDGEDKEVGAMVTGIVIESGSSFDITWSSDRGEPSGAAKQIGLTDVRVGVPFVQEFPGFTEDPFWIMLGLPGQSNTFEALAGQNLVQGIPGANEFYGEVEDASGNPIDFEDAAANVFTYENTTSGNASDGWTAPASLDAELPAGKGFIWYWFNNDQYGSRPLPFNFFTAAEPQEDQLEVSTNADVDFTLLGNPFNSTITVNQITGSGIQRTVQFWNPLANDYEPLSDDETIDKFGGFFVEASSAGDRGSEVFISPGAPVLREQPTAPKTLALELSGHNEAGLEVMDTSTMVRFRDDATSGWDVHDATKLQSLNARYASLSFIGEREGESVNKLVESLPAELAGPVELPLALDVVNFSGSFELGADLSELPESWNVSLLDTETDVMTDLRSGAYSFEAEGVEDAKALVSGPEVLAHRAGTALKSADPEGRFVLIIEPQPTSAPVDGELPQELALKQNYPNPFNPATQISYDLPESAEVRLDVFNVQGQRVATLVNGSQNAGSHSINFDAGNLSSGVYLYRLQAGNSVLTRKMTLVK